MTGKTVLGIIGGSGLYSLADSDGGGWRDVDTPWGRPSSPLFQGTIEGIPTVFLPRHGQAHTTPPSEINYRANIDALKRLGVSDVVSISACGSLKENLSPGTFVLVDQYVDRTFSRASSFFGPGCVAHVSMAHPVSPRLLDALDAACMRLDVTHVKGGTYVCIEGPQFGTMAESHFHRAQGWDVVGMTNMPEAKLAREAELPYACVAMVTDWDSWRDDGDHVNVTDVLRVLRQNTEQAGRMVIELARILGPERSACPGGAETALEHAIITPPEHRDPELIAKLDAVAGRLLNQG
jgi:5'-methylthioadenosine phosphorylase